jgi:hypothetical protein
LQFSKIREIMATCLTRCQQIERRTAANTMEETWKFA